MAEVDFCGNRRRVCVDTVPEAGVGDYVVVHAGVAISVMDEPTALQTIDDLMSMTQYRESRYDNISD